MKRLILTLLACAFTAHAQEYKEALRVRKLYIEEGIYFDSTEAGGRRMSGPRPKLGREFGGLAIRDVGGGRHRQDTTVTGGTDPTIVNRVGLLETAVAALETAVAGKEPAISPGIAGQYWSGPKTWSMLDRVAVGLGNVDNTSDASKPVSTATQTALNGKQNALGYTPENAANKAQANGYASLGADGKVPSAQLPVAGSDPWVYLVLGNDFTTSSATAVDVTGLSFSPAAGTRYTVEGQFLLRTATATVGPRPGVAWPSGMTDGVTKLRTTSSATTFLTAQGNISGAVLTAGGGLPTTTGSWPGFLEATLIAGSSPSGTFKVQLASETAGTTVRMQAGSFIRYRTY